MTVVCAELEEFLVKGEGRYANGALPNGTRVRKTVMEPADGTPIGAAGRVLGSTAMPPSNPPGFGYLIAWEGPPPYRGFTTGRKLEPIQPDPTEECKP
jgi:hypothetical protein